MPPLLRGGAEIPNYRIQNLGKFQTAKLKKPQRFWDLGFGAWNFRNGGLGFWKFPQGGLRRGVTSNQHQTRPRVTHCPKSGSAVRAVFGR